MTPNVHFEEGSYGLRAILLAPWSEEMGQSLKLRQVAEIEINHAKGWKGKNVDFLASFPSLLSLTIIDLTIESVASIHALPELRRLDLTTYCKTKLNFSAFPHLEDCGLEWRNGAESIFGCVTLRRLFINRYDGIETGPFGKLRNLEELAILGAPIKSLEGLRPLIGLRSLRIGNCRSLASLSGIENLHDLESLEIDTCRRIASIDEVNGLRHLKRLFLNNDGNLRSIGVLRGHPTLEVVTFSGSTRIVDGDLSPLKSIKTLRRVAFKDRPSYSHRNIDFGIRHGLS